MSVAIPKIQCPVCKLMYPVTENHYHTHKDNALDEQEINVSLNFEDAESVLWAFKNEALTAEQAAHYLKEWSDKRLLGLIGEDEIRPASGPKRNGIEQGLRRARNKLRAELRNKLKGASDER